MPRYIIHEKDGEEIFRGIWNGEITSDMPDGFANITMRIVYEQDAPEPSDVVEEARNANPELFSNTEPVPDPMGDALERQRAANARLLHKDDDLNPQAPSDWDMDGQGVVEAVEAVPYVPDFTIIPDALAKFALADESAAEFRARLKGLWQRFGIEDGHHFPGGGEPLTGEEKITMREIDIVLNSDEGKNASLLEWMLAGERRT